MTHSVISIDSILLNVFVFGVFLGLMSQSTIFSHVGTEPPLPGYYQYFLGGSGVATFKKWLPTLSFHNRSVDL